jgi:hypothetical protein
MRKKLLKFSAPNNFPNNLLKYCMRTLNHPADLCCMLGWVNLGKSVHTKSFISFAPFQNTRPGVQLRIFPLQTCKHILAWNYSHHVHTHFSNNINKVTHTNWIYLHKTVHKNVNEKCNTLQVLTKMKQVLHVKQSWHFFVWASGSQS